MINIQALAEKQKQLDAFVEKRVQAVQEDFKMDSIDTMSKIVFAFHVELAELANEIGFFKYWKLSHSMNRSRTLDEWADCLHFLLSYSNLRRYTPFLKDIEPFYLWEDYPLHELFYLLRDNDLSSSGYVRLAFSYLFGIGLKLGFSEEELIAAYEKKHEENLKRMESGY